MHSFSDPTFRFRQMLIFEPKLDGVAFSQFDVVS
jgi:hypothetical protein